MHVHANRRLFDLAQKDAQRRRLDELRARDSILHRLWAGKTLEFHPETPHAIGVAYSRATAIHSERASIEVVRSQTTRTALWARAAHWLVTHLEPLPEGEYLASFGGGDWISFGSDSCWIPNLPITLVTAAEVVEVVLADRSRPLFDQFALAQENGVLALVLDSRLGTISEDPGAEEIVYELTVLHGVV